MARGKQLTDTATTQKINLSVLQRMDPDVVDVLAKAGHVTLYDFDTLESTWSRKQVEGALFVVKRKSSPEHQFCVLNRLSTENVVEDLQEGFAYEVSGPYLLYKNRSGQVIGIWFYEARELSAVIGLLQQIMGDTMQPSDTTSGRIQEKESVAPVQETDVGAVENHDIIRMLSQAKVVVDTERIPSSLEPTSRSPVKAVPEADAESGPTLLAPSFFSSKHSASPAPLTKEKLRLAMQRLVQNEQFIEMLYQELLEP